MNVTWRKEPDGRHWTALLNGRQLGRVTQLGHDETTFWQGLSLRNQDYNWQTRPCSSLDEAKHELLELLAGRRARWVRPDRRFKQKLPNRPQRPGPEQGWRPMPNSPD